MATASAVMARYETAGVEVLAAPLHSAEDQAVTENLPLVRYIAARIASTIPASVELDDLIQTGTLGLIDAVRRFDPSKGIPFPAYARYRIRGAILDALRALDWATRNQRTQRKAAANASWGEESADSTPVQLTFFSLGPVVSLSSGRASNEDLPAPDVPCGENLHPDRLFEANESRVSQIHKAALGKMKQALASQCATLAKVAC